MIINSLIFSCHIEKTAITFVATNSGIQITQDGTFQRNFQGIVTEGMIDISGERAGLLPMSVTRDQGRFLKEFARILARIGDFQIEGFDPISSLRLLINSEYIIHGK